MAAAALPVAAEPKVIPLAEYLKTSYKPDCDFVDGRIEERRLGEKPHSRLQILIGTWLVNHEVDWSIQPMTEQRIRVSGDRVRIADLCVLRADAPDESVVVTPPLLCIEILSPEDRLSRAKLILKDYRAMGVTHVWLIDPLHRCAYVFDAEGLRLLESTERLEAPGTPVYLPLDDLFARLD